MKASLKIENRKPCINQNCCETNYYLTDLAYTICNSLILWLDFIIPRFIDQIDYTSFFIFSNVPLPYSCWMTCFIYLFLHALPCLNIYIPAHKCNMINSFRIGILKIFTININIIKGYNIKTLIIAKEMQQSQNLNHQRLYHH